MYRMCPEPITSYGIICCDLQQPDSVRYLMVQRKDSLCFVEFMRGKYTLQDGHYIKFLLSNMTKDERANLSTADSFDGLWLQMWSNKHNNRVFQKEFEGSRLKFDALSRGCDVVFDAAAAAEAQEGEERSRTEELPRCRRVCLCDLLKETAECCLLEREWGFPKGRRNLNEDNLQCALREFTEETGLGSQKVKMYAGVPCVQEVFKGSNGVTYRHVYYTACLQGDSTLPANLSLLGCREIKTIAWFQFQEVCQKIPAHNVERLAIVHYVHNLVVRSGCTTAVDADHAAAAAALQLSGVVVSFGGVPTTAVNAATNGVTGVLGTGYERQSVCDHEKRSDLNHNEASSSWHATSPQRSPPPCWGPAPPPLLPSSTGLVSVPPQALLTSYHRPPPHPPAAASLMMHENHLWLKPCLISSCWTSPKPWSNGCHRQSGVNVACADKIIKR